MQAFVRVPAPLAASFRRALLPAGMLLLAAASLASAQAPEAPEAPKAPRQAIAINPIGAVFGFYQAEIERSVLPGISIGLSSSYWNMGVTDDEESLSADVS